MSYDLPGTDIKELVDDLRADDFHEEIRKADVTVDVILKYAPQDKDGKPKGPALTLHGWPCAATIKITPHMQRVLGVADAVLTIDGDRWVHWADARKRAIIDHELYHLIVNPVGKDEYATDDWGRPKINLREHDWNASGFSATENQSARTRLERKRLLGDREAPRRRRDRGGASVPVHRERRRATHARNRMACAIH